VAFELDSPERESGEGSTTPCGVKGVVGPGSRAQIRLAVEKTECPLQRTTTLLKKSRLTELQYFTVCFGDSGTDSVDYIRLNYTPPV